MWWPFAKGEGGLAVLAEEYQDFLRAYEQDRSIMRFRLSEYSTHRIGVVLGGIDLPERSFAAQPDFLRRCKMFITQDEIDRFFLAESADSRLDVYAFFCYPHTKEEQQKFIKKCFGEYSGGGCDGYDYKEVKAKAFLIEMLKDGEMLSSDCEEKLEAAGFRKSTIKKAKKNAGVISRKKGFLWYWSLPMGDIPRE